ncbi:MAG TPA: hypothetical protein VF002_02165 [Gaiellaceae bacterium]
MPNRRDVVAEQLRTLADDLESLWRAATRDPKQEARRRRAWLLVSGALTAGATMASRKALEKLWPILTGEASPAAAGEEPEPSGSGSRPTAEAVDSETPAAA